MNTYIPQLPASGGAPLSTLKTYLKHNQEDYENKTMEEKEKYGKDLILNYYKLIYSSWCYKSLLTSEKILEVETNVEEGKGYLDAWGKVDLDAAIAHLRESDDSGYDSTPNVIDL